MAAEASSSSISKPPVYLMDLRVDILLKILRDFLPLKDKLHALFEMKEFRQLVTYRGAYLSIFPVSVPSVPARNPSEMVRGP